MFNKKIFAGFSVLLLTILSILPLVSAYNGWGWGYGYFSLQQLFQNPIIFFALIFLVFFALTYFALSRTMHENKGAAVIISAVMALFIAFTVSQKTRFYSYVGETIGSYLLIIALILALIILIRFITSIIGGFGLFLSLGVLWFILKSIDTYSFLPSEFLYSNFFSVYEFLSGSGFLTLLIIAFIAVLVAAYGGKSNEKIKDWLWGKKRPETYLDRLLRRT